jgi:hypothetical protein
VVLILDNAEIESAFYGAENAKLPSRLCGGSDIDVPLALLLCSMGFAGYVAVCLQLYSRCFPVLHLVVTVLHYMFRPTWPSSSV